MTEPRACILSVSGARLTAGEAKLLSRVNPWGVILMGRSCETPTQVTALTQSIWSATGRETLDLHRPGRRPRPPPAPAGMAGLSRRRKIRRALCEETGRRAARPSGSTIGSSPPNSSRWASAPIARRWSISRHPGAHDIVGDRSFGDKPEQVAVLARAALEGLARRRRRRRHQAHARPWPRRGRQPRLHAHRPRHARRAVRTTSRPSRRSTMRRWA